MAAPTWPGRYDRLLLWFLRILSCVGVAALLGGLVRWVV